MNEALITFGQVLIIFVLIALGFIVYKIKVLNADAVSQLTSFLLKIVVPCLIIDSLNMDFDSDILVNIGVCVLLVMLSHFVFVLLANLVFLKKKDSYTSKFAIIFSNCGFMGIPLINALLGPIGVIYAGVYNAMFNFFTWTYGISLFDRHRKGGKVTPKKLINPGTVGLFIGLVVFILPFDIPSMIMKPVEYVGSLNTPLAMLVIGATLAQSDFRKIITNKLGYFVTALRLIICPVIMLFIFSFINADITILKTIALLNACPCATLLTLIAKEKGTQTDVDNGICFFSLSTALSIFSVPLISILTNIFFG